MEDSGLITKHNTSPYFYILNNQNYKNKYITSITLNHVNSVYSVVKNVV